MSRYHQGHTISRTRPENGSLTSTPPSVDQERASAAQNQQIATLHQQVTTLQKQLSQREVDLTQFHQQEQTTTRTHNEQITTLRATIARLEKEGESLEGQLHLASQLTVSLTGLPSLEPLLAATHSLRVQEARVEQVSLGTAGSQKKTRTAKQTGTVQDAKALHQLQETLEALTQRMTLLTQRDAETKQLQRDLAQLTHQPPASNDQKRQEAQTPQLHPREQRKLERLVEYLTHVPQAPFQCALVNLLLQHEGQEFSYAEIARHLHYDVNTVQKRSTTALREEGLLARASSVMGYTSRFSQYCSTRFPGADERVIRAYLVKALTSFAEGKGAL